MARSRVMLRRAAVLSLGGCILAASGLTTSAVASGTGSLQGAVYKDLNQNQTFDSGEEPLANMQLYLYDATGSQYYGTTVTDSTGRYSFSGLVAGSYQVSVDPAAWGSWQQNWVPTTTGGDLYPRRTVSVAGSTVSADFGIRPITRSTTLGSPLSVVTDSAGLRVESYDDALTAQQIYDDLASGSLVGAESGKVTVRFDISSSSSTSTAISQSNGTYTDYNAVSYISYGSWLSSGDATLFHEYGHAWSLYYAYIVQQDPSLSGYLAARGLTGDSRVGTSYEWSPREMIAEDYRQLFGTPNARAQAQMNTAIPPASQVAGLADYLSGPFRTAPASGSTASASGSTQPAFDVTAPSVSPTPVSKSATVSTSVSLPSTVTLQITDAAGNVVRTLLASSSQPAGSVSAPWDRKSSSGSRVRSGTYAAVVTATDQYGRTVTRQTSFKVS